MCLRIIWSKSIRNTTNECYIPAVETQTLVNVSNLYTNMADRVCLIYETWYTNVICPLNMIYCSSRREDGTNCSCPTNVYYVVPGYATTQYLISSRLVVETRAVRMHVTAYFSRS